MFTVQGVRLTGEPFKTPVGVALGAQAGGGCGHPYQRRHQHGSVLALPWSPRRPNPCPFASRPPFLPALGLGATLSSIASSLLRPRPARRVWSSAFRFFFALKLPLHHPYMCSTSPPSRLGSPIPALSDLSSGELRAAHPGHDRFGAEPDASGRVAAGGAGGRAPGVGCWVGGYGWWRLVGEGGWWAEGGASVWGEVLAVRPALAGRSPSSFPAATAAP
jgi:hypothetical protein